jgi:LacI family gluconate utilization system Gnt-I transcriptional repressor
MALDKLEKPKRAPATLAQVARMAGVSEITVSRAVRNHPSVTEATRNRVLEVVRELGYVPNRIAGSLASTGSKLLGVIVPSLSNIVFPEVLAGIHAAAGAAGYQAFMGVSDYDPHEEERLVGSLLSWKPAAMLIAGFDHTDTARRYLLDSGVRVAELMDIGEEPIDIAVGLSHFEAGRASGKHLVQRGYRRIGYVGHDWDADRRARIRCDGLRAALSETGLSLAGEKRFEGPSSALAGRDTLAALLAASPDADAVVFSNDDMAIGGVFHLIAAGIPVREKVAVFGFNGLDIGQVLPFPLSTVRSNRFNIGKTAVEIVLQSSERPEQRRVVDTGFDIIEGATA